MPLTPSLSPATRHSSSSPPPLSNEDTSIATSRPNHHHINIPTNASSPLGLLEAQTLDPWSHSSKYALGWVYFCLLLLCCAVAKRWYLVWRDGMRVVAIQATPSSIEEEVAKEIGAERGRVNAVPSPCQIEKMARQDAARAGVTATSSTTAINRSRIEVVFDTTTALVRYIVYRTIPNIPLLAGWRPMIFPSLPALLIITAAFAFVTLYCFIPHPLYRQDIASGSPPLAIRAGMIAVAMLPWLVALSMKANVISVVTGLGHERLNVLHRWGGWICLFLGLVHTVPFYVTPVWESEGSREAFGVLYEQARGGYVYGSGIAALVPLLFLCGHSLPWLRHWMYEVFVVVHVPVAIVFLAMLFWHCNDYLTSWNYLWATLAIWLFSYALRILFFLNWTNYWRLAWLVGDEASILVLPENAIKVTIATREKWKPGQYVYLRLPGISVSENHPFTITSLCSSDFPSEHGEGYRDMTLVFRPFRGFTRRVLEAALDNGPLHTYRAFLDGPYGGMTRSLDSFDHVLLIAGGSGITALTSHLLYLIKRMRQGKAVTRTVQVVWVMKRPDVMSWFKEELRICRQYAPPGSMKCQFYITAAKRLTGTDKLVSANTPSRAVGNSFEYKVNTILKELTMSPRKRHPHHSNQFSARRETFIKEDAGGDSTREQNLRRENEDSISPLPEAYLRPQVHPRITIQEKRRLAGGRLTLDTSVNEPSAISDTIAPTMQGRHIRSPVFGFPNTPTELQKSFMHSECRPNGMGGDTNWHTDYGRPDIASMLGQLSESFGKRNCVFVCGPPSMRMDVANTVAGLQRLMWDEGEVEEVYLHTENYSL